MLFVFCTEVLFLQYIVAFVPCSYQFKNYIVVETGLLHSQPFMSSRFHFLVTRNQPLTKCRFSSPDECCLLCLLQVLPPVKKYNTWLTQNLQARKSYLLNIPYIKETKIWIVSIHCESRFLRIPYTELCVLEHDTYVIHCNQIVCRCEPC